VDRRDAFPLGARRESDVLYPHYRRARLLLAVALVAVIGLTYAVVVLARARRPDTMMIDKHPLPRAHHLDLTVTNSACIASADTGERLDHSGRR